MIHSFKTTTPFASSSTRQGALAEDRALAYRQRQGLAAVVRNYRCKGGEIDLIVRVADGTLVFVEVRQRSGRGFGDAAASITPAKQRRVLARGQPLPCHARAVLPCRVDVVALDAGRLEWLPDAFDLGAWEAGGGDSQGAAS